MSAPVTVSGPPAFCHLLLCLPGHLVQALGAAAFLMLAISPDEGILGAWEATAHLLPFHLKQHSSVKRSVADSEACSGLCVSHDPAAGVVFTDHFPKTPLCR